MNDALMTTYGRLPVTFTRGEGSWLWDDAGNKYLDTFSGVAVCGLGHAHPAVADAICDQARTLMHTSNWFGIANQSALGRELTALTGMDNVFFSNSGAEAVEAAIKLARLYGHERQIDKPAIIVMENSFHGRTLATLTASGNRKVQAGFEPLVSGFVRVPFNDLAAIRTVAESDKNVVAVLAEPVQGEGGINIPDADYLPTLRRICDEQQWLLMLDEIQSGMGRSGQWFAYQHHNILPDVCTLAKGLANGFPIGACLASGRAAALFTPGKHGSTFGGNPLACRAALATLEVMRRQNLPAQAAANGSYLLQLLRDRLKDKVQVTTVRGLGLLLGIQLDRPCSAITQMGLRRGLLLNVTAESVVRLLPALTASRDELQLMAEGVCATIEEFLQAGP